MNRKRATWVAVACLSVATAALGKFNVEPNDKLQWKDAGIPGVWTATVAGDMASTPSRFYLKYKAGLVTPLHHHTTDHYVTTVAGTLVLVVDGKENSLAPGSYFSLTEKQPHIARCEGSADCVMFILADGPWDVVPVAATP
jgi:mannose-6-phosphate isomerase-like protein (cupin superfamily)